MQIIDSRNLTHNELIEREMKLQSISREEAEKYWQNVYKMAEQNDRDHEKFMNQLDTEENTENLLSEKSLVLSKKINDFKKKYPDISKFNLAEYLSEIYKSEKELDMNLIQYIFSLDIKYKTITDIGISAFCVGLLLKNVELTKLFISKGIDIKSPITYKADKDKYLESEEYRHYYPFGEYNDYIEVVPFNFACMTNYYENIVILIENGISINTPIYYLNRLKIGIIDNESITVCNLALSWNNIELMRYLIQNSEFNDENNNLLIEAVGEYKLEMIELLLPHKKNSCFFADLTKVIEYKNLPLLKKLVDSGAELNEEYNGFAYSYSFMSSCIESDLSLDKKSDEKYFKEYSYLDIVKFLLEKGIDLNQGNTNPLMLSLNIDLGLDLGIVKNYGHTINYRMANLLIERGADINYCDNDGKSILMSACEPKLNNGDSSDIEKKISLINLLIKNGADVNHKDKNGNSVIMYISDDNSERQVYNIDYTDDGREKVTFEDLEIYPSEKILKILLENGADINAKNNLGITPLMHFSLKGEEKLVKILLENGADINLKSEMTAFDLAKTDEIKALIKQSKNNSPQKLVKLLSNFTIDKPIKYTTHDWDFGELKKEYGDFDGYMNAVKKQFYTMKTELEELSPNLYKKIYTFLIEENPDENYSWCSKTHINIGWSSLEGLREHCDRGNLPRGFNLQKPIFMGRKQLVTFGEVINLFKQEIEIRADFKNLEQIFLSQNIQLDLSAAKLNTRQFYTDTQKLSNVLGKIFYDMGNRKDFKNIEVTTTELDDRSIEIKIIQLDSNSTRSPIELLERAKEAGDISDIKESLKNLCDWSIETSFEDENFRVNFLHSNNVKDVEILETKPKGFTHILRFYK